MLGNISKIGGKHYQNSFQHIDLDKTHPHDTHPSVNDRAKALGIKPVAPEPSAENALALLGDELPRVIQQLSQTWFEDIKESWQIRHEEETATQQQADQLLKSQTGDRLPLHEHAALAETLECEGNLKAAYDAYTRLYKRRGLNYDKARAALCLAKLGGHDQRVLRLVDQVKKQNPLTDLVVYETMAALADTQGEYEDYLCLHEELDDECEDMLEPYLFELGPLLGWPRKTIPLTLTDSELERARIWFSALQDVGSVAIAQLPFHPEYPQAPIVLFVVQPRRGATPEPGYTEDLLDGFYLDNGLFRVLDGRFYPLLFARYAKSSRGLLIHSDAKKRIAPSVHEQD